MAASKTAPAEAIATLVAPYPASTRRVVQEARRVLRKRLDGAVERVDEPAHMLAYSYGPGYRGLVCTLILSQTGVKLGLNQGASLDDPRGLLRGSGKVHRHIQFRTPQDIQQTGVNALIDLARALCHKRIEAAGNSAFDGKRSPDLSESPLSTILSDQVHSCALETQKCDVVEEIHARDQKANRPARSRGLLRRLDCGFGVLRREDPANRRIHR